MWTTKSFISCKQNYLLKIKQPYIGWENRAEVVFELQCFLSTPHFMIIPVDFIALQFKQIIEKILVSLI